MNNTWNTAIDKLMFWSSNSWARYDQKSPGNMTLRIHNDQLLLTTDINVLESLNINSKMKGVYKGDVLILIVSMADQQIRKLRFQIMTNVAQCLSKLGEYFPVMSHDCLQSKNTITTKYRPIEEIFKQALTINSDQGTIASLPMPSDYKNFIKLCLLDPTFPQLVSETAKILQDNKIEL